MNVYVVGPSLGYAKWLPERKLVSTMYEADIIMFTGGEDINPALYNEKPTATTYWSPTRDNLEVEAFNAAIKLKKPMIGTCRGAQLFCALSGGRLFQDVSHPYKHEIITTDGQTLITNSLHHQMCNPYGMRKSEYEVLAWANDLSPYLFDGNRVFSTNRPTDYIKEPEVIFFPKTRALGIQGHPEMMQEGETLNYFKRCLEKLF